MSRPSLFFAANPFFEAYAHADFLGRLIFLSLIATSVICWAILLHKIRTTYMAREAAKQFQKAFRKNKDHPLQWEAPRKAPNPFYDLYAALKQQTIDLLNKNRRFGAVDQEKEAAYLSPSDMESLESHLFAQIASQTRELEKNLFILSTIVGLSPLLGLLGTVWGILITFADMQSHGSGTGSQLMLHGLSLALTTTVLGLLIAIPALIAYSYLRNAVRGFETEMEGFSTEVLSSVEMQYRKVDFS